MVAFDEIAEKTGDDLWDIWKKQVLDASDETASFVTRYRSGAGAEVIDWFEGPFNFCLQVTFNDTGSDTIIRLARPGPHSTFRDENITNEVHVIKFLCEQTEIPISCLLGWGLTEDNPCHFGPFIISDFVDRVHLSDILRNPALDLQYGRAGHCCFLPHR